MRPHSLATIFFGIVVAVLVSVPAAGVAPVSAAVSDTLVINEMAPRGPGAADDEHVELRNNSTMNLDISGWTLAICRPPSPPITVLAFPFGTVIPAGGSILLAGTGYTGGRPADYIYTFNVPDDGGWRVHDDQGNDVDRAGFSGGGCTEGSPAAQCNWGSGQVAARILGLDTDNNALDFRCR